MPHTILSSVDLRAKQWGLPAALVQAVVSAEGGEQAIIKAVKCSLPGVDDLYTALSVVCRSLTHRMWEYVSIGQGPANAEGFLAYFASKWAPLGVANDPTNLNANWPKNAIAIYKELTGG